MPRVSSLLLICFISPVELFIMHIPNSMFHSVAVNVHRSVCCVLCCVSICVQWLRVVRACVCSEPHSSSGAAGLGTALRSVHAFAILARSTRLRGAQTLRDGCSHRLPTLASRMLPHPCILCSLLLLCCIFAFATPHLTVIR